MGVLGLVLGLELASALGRAQVLELDHPHRIHHHNHRNCRRMPSNSRLLHHSQRLLHTDLASNHRHNST